MGTITMTVLVEVAGDNERETLPVVTICRDAPACAGNLGLTLAESKAMLLAVQREVTAAQMSELVHRGRDCERCGARRAIKAWRSATCRTLFGAVALRVPRLLRCRCSPEAAASTTVRVAGLQNWMTPELEYVQSRLAATVQYARAAEILDLLLPAGAGSSTSSVRRHTLGVGERLEQDLRATQENEVATVPITDASASIGLDGGFIRDCRPRSNRSFEVIVGRIIAEGPRQRRLGFVRRFERSSESRERVRRRVAEEGLRPDRLAVFTDRDTCLRDLQLDVLPDSTRVLDWFHLTRHLTLLRKILVGEEGIRQLPTRYHDPLLRALTSLKWRLWLGQSGRAVRKLRDFIFTLRLHGIRHKRVVRKLKLKRHANRLLAYLKVNEDSLPDYGRRYRTGERVASSFVESAVNQLIDKRMSKSQQMRWSHAGAHLLLQVRADVVDQRLGAQFERWYPGLKMTDRTAALAARPPWLNHSHTGALGIDTAGTSRGGCWYQYGTQATAEVELTRGTSTWVVPNQTPASLSACD